MTTHLYRLQCAAITNGCLSAFAIDGPPGIDPDHLDRAVPEDQRVRELLQISGWHQQHGRWVCANHEPVQGGRPLLYDPDHVMGEKP